MLVRLAMALRTAVPAAPVRVDVALLAGLAAVVLATGVTLGAGTPIAYLVVGMPLVLVVSWWRPVYGFAALLGLVLIADEYEHPTLAAGIEPFLLQTLPIFKNIREFAPLSVAYANAVELWLALLVAIWLAKGVSSGRLRTVGIPCLGAWALAALTLATAFTLGIAGGGDVKIALWEVRALGYLLALAWLVPQLMERRRDLVVVLTVMVAALGLKAVQGLYGYFIILGMQLELRETFMAHEDPVMFVPLFFLLSSLWYYRAEPGLRRLLLVAAPAMFLALLFTQRRVAYIGLALCAVLYVVELSAPARRTVLRYGLPVVAALAAYVVAFAGSASPLGQPIERALSLFDAQNPSNLYRVLELENLRYTIQRHPWGIGFGNPYEIIRSLPYLDFSLQDYLPHNEVMWMWVKTGTAGFVVVMFFFARLIAEGGWIYRHVRDPLLRSAAAIVPLAIANQLVVSSFELQLTYTRNMIFLGTLIGLLGPIREWSGLATRGRGLGRRWALFRGAG